MIHIDKIQKELLHLVGFEDEVGCIEGATAGAYMQESESGLYFQQAHPLITLDNLYSIAPDFSSLEDQASYVKAEAYKKTKAYSKGDTIVTAGSLYTLRRDMGADEVGTIPANNPGLFSRTTPFTKWLDNKVQASISKVVNRFITEKYSSAISKPILERKTLFDGAGRLCDIIENRHKIVGFEIVPIRAKGISVKINRIGIQVAGPCDIELNLFHSSSSEPVKTMSVSAKAGFNWIDVPSWLLNYNDDTIDSGGSWYLAYRQSDNVEAINKDLDWSKGPCKSCSASAYSSWRAWSRFMEVHPFCVPDDQLGHSLKLWDVSTNEYRYDKNWGLNLDISIYCDLTDFIIREKAMFTDVLMKQFAVDMLREFAYNPNVRTNRHSISASRMDILYELDGDSSSMKKSGLSWQLDNAYKALDISTQGLDRVCLPCKNNGIKYRTV